MPEVTVAKKNPAMAAGGACFDGILCPPGRVSEYARR